MYRVGGDKCVLWRNLSIPFFSCLALVLPPSLAPNLLHQPQLLTLALVDADVHVEVLLQPGGREGRGVSRGGGRRKGGCMNVTEKGLARMPR